MNSNILTYIYSFTLITTMLIIIRESNAKPWPQNPLDQPAFLVSGSKSCAQESENICQRCAKRTESPVVYPWCCTNHEGAKEWCENYLFFGLQ